MLKARLFLAAAALILTSELAAHAADIRIKAIRAQLFYETSGTLSEDIIVSKPSLWNIVIGEGDAREPANSFLAIVDLEGPKEAFEEQVLKIDITLTDREGESRKVVSRSFDGLFFTEKGRLAKAVLAENAVCGDVTITASLGSNTKSETIPFGCGE